MNARSKIKPASAEQKEKSSSQNINLDLIARIRHNDIEVARAMKEYKKPVKSTWDRFVPKRLSYYI